MQVSLKLWNVRQKYGYGVQMSSQYWRFNQLSISSYQFWVLDAQKFPILENFLRCSSILIFQMFLYSIRNNIQIVISVFYVYSFKELYLTFYNFIERYKKYLAAAWECLPK